MFRIIFIPRFVGMKHQITASQLAFLLGIKVGDARDKMVHAWCKEKQLDYKSVSVSDGGLFPDQPEIEVEDTFPAHMDLDVISRQCNLPNLEKAYLDIKYDYLNRKTTRGYIMSYPETIISKKLKAGSTGLITIKIPSVLESILDKSLVEEIYAK